jgi:hypothetical protein
VKGTQVIRGNRGCARRREKFPDRFVAAGDAESFATGRPLNQRLGITPDLDHGSLATHFTGAMVYAPLPGQKGMTTDSVRAMLANFP